MIEEIFFKNGTFPGPNTEEGGFACYRLPHEQELHFVAGPTVVCEEPDETLLNTGKGFFIAPFHPLAPGGKSLPQVLILPQLQSREQLAGSPPDITVSYTDDEAANRKRYGEDFRRCIRLFQESNCSKFVLSRCRELCLDRHLSLEEKCQLFRKACFLYPDSYVALWQTRETGTWLTATPETLLEQAADGWETMALAGTRPSQGNACGSDAGWTAKNRHEQRLVQTFIESRLRPLSKTWHASGTRSFRAGNIEHLRTDFRFAARPGITLSRLLSALHPTPAVCGCPQDEALRIIRQCERHTRNYYAGFSGPLRLDGRSAFYVSLRCMQLKEDKAELYAGGGILKESQEGDEWLETQRKMQTMLRLFEPLPQQHSS